MKEMIAVCGLDCSQCGAFLATKENDDKKRAKVAQEWSKLLKWRSNLKILVVKVANLWEALFSITTMYEKLG